TFPKFPSRGGDGEMIIQKAWTRREALITASALAFVVAQNGIVHAAANGERFARLPAVDPRQRLLLKSGTIISMDPRIGDLANGDVLIEGTKISAVAPNINAGNAQVIDARNMILIPGLIDCHRHSWEGQL